jgi:hypothetical protein
VTSSGVNCADHSDFATNGINYFGSIVVGWHYICGLFSDVVSVYTI